MAETLCWRCKNAVPSKSSGCSWSREFKPVEGWTADRRDLKMGKEKIGDYIESYFVHKCPKFERG